MRKTRLYPIVSLLAALLASSALASTIAPKERPSRTRNWETAWDGGSALSRTKEGSAADTVWVKVQNDSACSFTNSNIYGGRGETSPGWSVWCFDGGLGDSCSSTTAYNNNPNLPGCWTHYDAHIFGQTNKWHVATYDTYLPGSQDSSMWCGELGDTLSWEWPPGYAQGWGFSVTLNLGNSATFNAANGCTIGGVHLFSLELAYDYCFVEMSASGIPDTASWAEIARFNGVSNPDSVNCRGLGGSYWGATQGSGIGNGPKPYLCADWTTMNIAVPAAKITSLGQNGAENLFVRWRVLSDFFWDDLTGNGTQSDTRGAWRLDHVNVKGRLSPNSYFPANDPARADVVDFENAGCAPATPLCEPGRTAFSTTLLPRAELAGGYWSGTWVHGKAAVIDLWHLTNTPTYPNQAKTCESSNIWVWSSALTPGGVDGNIDANGFLYRLASPVFDLSPNSPLTAGTGLANTRITGFNVFYDNYLCIKQVSSDVTSFTARNYVGAPQNAWNPQWQLAGIFVGGCQFWNISDFDSWAGILSNGSDSIQVGYDMFDQCDYNSNTAQGCMPGITVANPHRKNAFVLDNFSVGLFEQRSTLWGVGRFQDTFARDVHLHPIAKENWELFPGDVRQDEDSVAVSVSDIDGLVANNVVVHYRVSTDCGTSWSHESSRPQGSKAKPTIEWYTKTLNFSQPDPDAEQGQPTEFNGTYRTTLEVNATDFPGGQLSGGLFQERTVVEYYFTARDLIGNRDTVPSRAAVRRTFIHPLYGTERQDPWPYEVTVLPCNAAAAYTAQGGKEVLVVDEFDQRTVYDSESDPKLGGTGTEVFPRCFQLYEEAMRDLNVKYDRYDNFGSGVIRGEGAGPFYAEPTNSRGYGGIRNPGSGTHRYKDVIWATGTFNFYAVTDSSTIEVGQYLASDVNEGNMWLAGVNVCEDEDIFGITESFGGGDFAVNYIGATLVSGGCPDNDGLTQKTYYVEGVNDAAFTPFQTYGGWSDCPLRNQPDNGFEINAAGQGTETIVFQFDNVAHTLNETAGILDVQPGTPNKMLTTMFGLENITTRAARACLTRAVLTKFGVTIPAGGKYSAANCAKPVGVPTPGAVRRFALDQNYPNPFNPSTKIRYALPKDNMKVALTIVDVSGREVRRLVDRLESGAEHEVFWDGRNDRGQDVASGVYFYRLTADDLSSTKKMVLLK